MLYAVTGRRIAPVAHQLISQYHPAHCIPLRCRAPPDAPFPSYLSPSSYGNRSRDSNQCVCQGVIKERITFQIGNTFDFVYKEAFPEFSIFFFFFKHHQPNPQKNLGGKDSGAVGPMSPLSPSTSPKGEGEGNNKDKEE